MPLSAIADAVSDFYKGKTVKIVIGGSMGGAYSLMHSFCPAMSIDIYPG
jgi:homoserine acetyltransferase